MVNNQLSICIVGKGNTKYLSECIECASKISRKIIYIDLGSDDQGKSKAKELGVNIADQGSLLSVLKSEWVLFIKSEERAVVSSVKKSKKMMMNKQMPGYGVYTRSSNVNSLLENYHWVRKVGQFKNVSDSAYVSKIEPRLTRRPYAEVFLDGLAKDNTEEISWICGNIAEGIVIESIPNDETYDEESPKDHDLRCLKGELVYDITPEDDMDEFSETYTGFRVVHKGLWDAFMESASRGFGNLKVYISMLDFLCQEGCFGEAKDLFEQWIKHRPDDKENYYAKFAAGVIYSNLLKIDRAIECLEMISETNKYPLVSANLGKLYLITNEKEKAIEYLRKSTAAKDDILIKQHILPIIEKKDWRPLKLSLCMIARDEEAVIENALQSVEGIVDEVVVVDTGSSDKTMEIVKEFGGKVIEAKWENDFSMAKNLAIEQATGDYILFMDADEYIDSRDRFSLAILKKLLPVAKDSAFLVKIEPTRKSKSLSVSALDSLEKMEEFNYQVRLFPAKPGMRFHGRVMEDPDQALRSSNVPIVRNNLIKITQSMHARQWRDERKMPAVMKSSDSINDPHKALKCGLIFLRSGNLDSAFSWLIQAVGINPGLSAKIGILYHNQNKLEMAKDIIKNAMEYFPDSPELALSIAEVYHKEERYDEVINTLYNRIEAIEKNPESEDAAKVHYLLGIASIETGDVAYGIEQLAVAHEKAPSDIRYKIGGIYAFAKMDQWEEALQVAAQIADEEGIEISICEVNNFVDVGQVFVEINRHFAESGKTEEANLCQKIVEDVIKTKISGDEDIRRMSAVIEAAESHG